MSFIRYSDSVEETCDACSCEADYGFFVSVTPIHEMNRPRDENFLCSGCAQATHDRATLQDAIDEAYDLDEEAAWNRAITGWLHIETLDQPVP